MHDLLAAIVACARTTVEERRSRVPLDTIRDAAAGQSPRGALFRERLARRDHVNIIAECKRRSPAKGVLCRDYRPEQIAGEYAAAGAAAISVLTEPAFFDGELAHLSSVRKAVDVPLLRKDFVVDEYQVFEACAHGADAVLLIAAALDAATLASLLRAAEGLGLAALVEVHNREELDGATKAGASLIGVNSRNLKTLRVDLGTFETLAPHMPPGSTPVAESGLASVDDVRRLREAGYSGFLIGEWFMRSGRPGATLASLIAEVA